MSRHDTAIDALDLLPPITGAQPKRGHPRGAPVTTRMMTRSAAARETKPSEPILEEASIEPVSSGKGWRAYLGIPSLGRSSFSNTSTQVADATSSTSSATTNVSANTNTANSTNTSGTVPTQTSAPTRSASASSFLRRSLSVALGSPCLWWQHEEEKSSKKDVTNSNGVVGVEDLPSPSEPVEQNKALNDTRIDRQLAFDDDDTISKGPVQKRTATRATVATSKSKTKSSAPTVAASSSRKRERSADSHPQETSTTSESNQVASIVAPAVTDYESTPFWELVELCKQANLKLPTRPKKVDCIKQLMKAAKEAAGATQAVQVSPNKRARSSSVSTPKGRKSDSKGKDTAVAEPVATVSAVETRQANYDTMTAKALRELVRKRGLYTADMTTKAKMIAAMIEADQERSTPTRSKSRGSSPPKSSRGNVTPDSTKVALPNTLPGKKGTSTVGKSKTGVESKVSKRK